MYGYAQVCKLPSGKFRWLEDDEITCFDINSVDLDGKYGYIIECDLQYPKKIHDLHQNLPLAPEILTIDFDSLSPYANGCCWSRTSGFNGSKKFPLLAIIVIASKKSKIKPF